MNELEALRTIDPADETPDDRAAEQLLRAVLASPRPARGRRRTRRRVLVAVPVAAALLVALPVALNRGGDSLAARAYAATAPGEQIIHEVSVSQVLEPSGTPMQVQESWWRPSDGSARAVRSFEGGKPFEIIIGADGVAHLHSPYAAESDEVLNPPGSSDSCEPKSSVRCGRVATLRHAVRQFLIRTRSVTLGFRDDYADQQLRDEGMTTLDGRTIHAYSADTKEWYPEDHAYATYHRTFYVDPDTALPIAERVEMPGPGGKPLVFLTTVKRYEKLPATPENLALVRSQTSP